jgi:hypothetical protein
MFKRLAILCFAALREFSYPAQNFTDLHTTLGYCYGFVFLRLCSPLRRFGG